MISRQSGSLSEGGRFDGVSAGGGVTVEKATPLPVKNHVPIFVELVMEFDCDIQTESDFLNPKMTPTDDVTENCAISSDLIEVVIMDEDALNCDLMRKQRERISTLSFEGSDIGFKVGCGNVQGNKNKSKGRPKRIGNQEAGVSQSLYSPKKIASVVEPTTRSSKSMKSWKRFTTRPYILSNSSSRNVEPGHKRKQVENLNMDAIGVKREKKHRIVENKQGVISTMGSMKVAGQPCQA